MSVTVSTDDSNNSWFMAKDCAEILNYKDTRKAISDNVDVEDKCRLESKGGVASPSLNNQPHSVLINESGLYSLVIRSKRPEAKQFKRWITSEVLPSLRNLEQFYYNLII